MSNFNKFEFERSRGIIWVCDLANSSKYLNDNESVDDIEEYLPRLYWTSSKLVEAFGGKFIKWTGDGFLAWFETPLDRLTHKKADLVFQAAWHLSFLNNVTQLAVKPKVKFKLRHGITYEKDALLLNIHQTNNHKSMDVIGRSVVLAFRFSGIQAEFPGIVTEKEIATSESKIVHFRKWHPSKEDKLKHFKGEIWGTQSIYVSSDKKYSKNRTLSAARKQAKKAINKAEGSEPEPSVSYIAKFIELMEAGPKWCSDVIDLEQKFVKDELLETLKTVHSMLEEIEKETLEL